MAEIFANTKSLLTVSFHEVFDLALALFHHDVRSELSVFQNSWRRPEYLSGLERTLGLLAREGRKGSAPRSLQGTFPEAMMEDFIASFLHWKAERVQENPQILGGTPTFRGSRIAVRGVGLRAERESLAVIMEDYPDLSADDVKFAAFYRLASHYAGMKS